ncbi:hypothetical protein D047_4215B, partial [Vibrio parahaemolyticus VPTS-2010_2]
SSLSVRHLHE